MQPVRDLSRQFTLIVLGSWLALVALPLVVSLAAGTPAGGAPLLGVVVWFGLMRVGRTLSPAARVDALLRRGRAGEALALCDAALTLDGRGTWIGPRRLGWLNRRTLALLALGQPDTALASALDALAASANPETLGNCAMALLRLNRYDEAALTAKLALALTRHRSLLAHAALAEVMLARGMPAEAEALALAGAEDARALAPLVRREHYTWCLAPLTRAARSLAWQAAKRDLAKESREEADAAKRHLDELRRVAGGRADLRAAVLLEEADELSATPETMDLALVKLREAARLCTAAALWYVSQPDTLATLRDHPEVAALAEEATLRFDALRDSAPDAETVTAALAAAQPVAQPRAPRQASSLALITQVVTLGSTLLLLLLWAGHFFAALS